MSSVHAIPSGHAGSGRDGRKGDREKPAGTGESLAMISAGRAKNPTWCVHQLPMTPECRPQHDCLEFENEQRAARDCPPI